MSRASVSPLRRPAKTLTSAHDSRHFALQPNARFTADMAMQGPNSAAYYGIRAENFVCSSTPSNSLVEKLFSRPPSSSRSHRANSHFGSKSLGLATAVGTITPNSRVSYWVISLSLYSTTRDRQSRGEGLLDHLDCQRQSAHAFDCRSHLQRVFVNSCQPRSDRRLIVTLCFNLRWILALSGQQWRTNTHC
jgi:hypothetical protein